MTNNTKKIVLTVASLTAVSAGVLLYTNSTIKEGVSSVVGIKENIVAVDEARIPYTFQDAKLQEKILELLKKYKGANGPRDSITMTDPTYRKEQTDNTIYEDELAKITRLSLESMGITNISGVEKLTSIRQIELSRNNTVNIEPLRTLTGLTSLAIRNNQIVDIDPIKDMTSLTHLDIRANRIVNIEAVRNLRKVRTMWLNDNKIEDIDPLKELTELRILWVNNEKVKTIEPLRNLTNLTNLWFSDNEVVDIEPISGLTNLTNLWFNNNKVENLEPLRNLTKLTQLRIDKNKVSDLSIIQTLTGVTRPQRELQKIDVTPVNNTFTLNLLDEKATPYYLEDPKLERIGSTSEYRIKDITNLNKFTIIIRDPKQANLILWEVNITPNKSKITLKYKENNQEVKSEEKEYEPNAENGIAVGTIIENEARTKEYAIYNKDSVPARITENGTYQQT